MSMKRFCRTVCLFSLAIFFLSLASCSVLQSPVVPSACQGAETLTPECFDALYGRYKGFLQAGTQVAVGVYLSQFPDRARPMYDVISLVEARIGDDQLTSLAAVEALVRDTVDWDSLSPAVRAGVQGLITAVRTTLESVLADMGAKEPAEIRLIAKDVISWARMAVVIQCPDCRQETF